MPLIFPRSIHTKSSRLLPGFVSLPACGISTAPTPFPRKLNPENNATRTVAMQDVMVLTIHRQGWDSTASAGAMYDPRTSTKGKMERPLGVECLPKLRALARCGKTILQIDRPIPQPNGSKTIRNSILPGTNSHEAVGEC